MSDALRKGAAKTVAKNEANASASAKPPSPPVAASPPAASPPPVPSLIARAWLFLQFLLECTVLAVVLVAIRVWLSTPPMPTQLAATELTLRFHPRQKAAAFDAAGIAALSTLVDVPMSPPNAGVGMSLDFVACKRPGVKLTVSASGAGLVTSSDLRVSIRALDDCPASLFVTRGGATLQPTREATELDGNGLPMTFASASLLLGSQELRSIHGQLLWARRSDERPSIFWGYEQQGERFSLSAAELRMIRLRLVADVSHGPFLELALSDARSTPLEMATLGGAPLLSRWRWENAFAWFQIVFGAVAGLWGGMRGYLAYRTQNSRPQGGGP